MIEKKITLPSSHQKKCMVETKKINKLLPHIPTDNITKLNELIQAAAKLVCDEIGVH